MRSCWVAGGETRPTGKGASDEDAALDPPSAASALPRIL